jgi:hypothetical protein
VRQKIAEGESTAKEQGRALLKALEAQKTHTLTGYSLQRPSRPLLIIALARRGKAGVILTTTARLDTATRLHNYCTITCAECAGLRDIHCSTASHRPSPARTHPLHQTLHDHRSQPRSRRSQPYLYSSQTTQWATAGTPSAARTRRHHGAQTTAPATQPRPIHPPRATTARHRGTNGLLAIVTYNTCTRNCNTSSAKYGATHKDTRTKSSSWSSCPSSPGVYYTNSHASSA